MIKNDTRTEEKFSFFGREAKSAPNCDFPRIITINLKQQDAIALIKTVTERSLVIASEVRDRTMAIDALIAGADAVTFLEIEPEEMLLVRKAIAKGYTIVDRRQFPTRHFLVFPRHKIKAKLERWQKAIASEIFNYWRGMPLKSSVTAESWSLTNLVAQIGLKSGIPLENELARIIESLSRKRITNQHDLLAHIEIVLNKWYCGQTLFLEDGTPNCCLAILKTNTSQLIEAILAELEQSYPSWGGSGSYTLSQWLSGLISELRAFEAAAEQEHQAAFQKINSALNDDKELKRLDLAVAENFTSVLESLEFQYLERIKARSVLLAGEIIARSISALLIYREKAIANDCFLYQLQEHFSDGDSLDLLDLTKIEFFQLSQYRDRLTMKLGKSFIDWGELSQDKQEILKTEVLAKAERITWELIIEPK